MTQCTTNQITFPYYKKRKLSLDFDGAEITSDAGLLLILQADERMGLVKGLTRCVRDIRDVRYVDHDMQTLLRQRIYQVLAGYEDCNNANLLKRDPALKAACERLRFSLVIFAIWVAVKSYEKSLTI